MARKPTGKRSKAGDGTVRVHGKAANGEGSVYFAAGRWRATYWVPGEARRRSVTAATRDGALEKRRAVVTDLASSLGHRGAVSSRMTIGELAEWWLHNVQRHHVRLSTWSKAEDRVRRIVATLGSVEVTALRVEHVVGWQSDLLDTLAPKTVGHHRQTLAQVMDQAIELGLIHNNPVRRVKAPRVPRSTARALTVQEAQALVTACSDDRYGAAVALLFFQGWRVSEALGLAWDDIDLGRGVASIRRASVYVDHRGQELGPPKTAGVMGSHILVPTVVGLLRRRRKIQAADRLAHRNPWPKQTYDGRVVDLVFTTPAGELVNRQAITKVIASGAAAAGIDGTHLGTHTGRRSVVTALYAEGGESLEEIARFVGHASPTTTAGYVRDLGNRPAAFAERAARLLDPAAQVL